MQEQNQTDDVRRIFESIATHTVSHAGGTFQHRTGAPVEHADGYIVGVGKIATFECAAHTVPVERALVYAGLVECWPRTLPASAQYVGTWIDDGVCHVDYVTHIPATRHGHHDDARALALALARRNNEQSIYECATGACIDVPVFDDDVRELAEYLRRDDDADDVADDVRRLIRELHDALYGDVHRTIVDDALNIDDDATWIVERLRALTDAEYRECAYGADDDDDDARVGRAVRRLVDRWQQTGDYDASEFIADIERAVQ